MFLRELAALPSALFYEQEEESIFPSNILWQDFCQDHLPYRRRRPRCCWAPNRFHRVELQPDDVVQHGLFSKTNKKWMRSNKVPYRRHQKSDYIKWCQCESFFVFRLIMYLTMISVECDENLEIVHVHPWWQLIAIGFQIRPMRQWSSSVAWIKKKPQKWCDLIDFLG